MKAKIFFFTVLLITFLSKAQNVITVDNTTGSNAQYANLQEAIEVANNNDIIYIHASETNYGDIIVNKTLTIIGFSHSDPDKSTLINDITLGENASNSKFSGLHITSEFIVDNLNTTLTGLVFENNVVDYRMFFDDAGVDDMIIRGNIIWSLGKANSSNQFNNFTNMIISNNIIDNKIHLKNYQSITIKNNIFFYHHNSGSNFPIHNYGHDNGSITVQDNIFYPSANGTVSNIYSPGVIFENCLIFNIGAGNASALNGSNNLANIDPKFVSADNNEFDPDIDDYHLQAGSPAIGAGVAGGDIGLYNSDPFVFNNFGITAGIPTVKITAITNTIEVGGTVEVTIESNSN